VHDQRVDRTYGYPVPYRCFYSKDIDNLFMAGRCISVTHEALGTVRVMKTCGMMGEVVGKAAIEAVREGDWQSGHGLKGFVGSGYHYAARDSGATAKYELQAPAPGTYDVLVSWQPHENRGSAVPVLVRGKSLATVLENATGHARGGLRGSVSKCSYFRCLSSQSRCDCPRGSHDQDHG